MKNLLKAMADMFTNICVCNYCYDPNVKIRR